MLLLALPFVFYMSNSKSVRDHNALDRAVASISAPLQWLIVSSLDASFGLWHSYIGLVGVQADNDRLHDENIRLTTLVAERDEQAHENERLRLLVGLRERAPEVKMLFAQVIATSPSPLFRSLRIDKGRNDGIEVGAAVVSPAGIVGRVAALGDNFADIMLLTDANSSTDVLVQRTRARARVRGQGGDDGFAIEAQYLARTADVEPGDVLITSGLSRVFPKGLVAGRVISVERRAFGLYQRAMVQPNVDFSRIEAVMVILSGFGPTSSFEVVEGEHGAGPGAAGIVGVPADGAVIDPADAAAAVDAADAIDAPDTTGARRAPAGR